MTAEHELRRVEVFADLEEDHIAWLAEHAHYLDLEPGEILFREGDPATVLFAIIEGEIRARREEGPSDDRVIVRTAGNVTGMLPHSRLTQSPFTGRATIFTRVATLSTDLFPEMLRRIPCLQARLAAVMVDRSREYTRRDDQREKLLSLGKLSAGLAHELNNPAAAIQRRADELAHRLQTLSDVARSLLERQVEHDRLVPLLTLATIDRAAAGGGLDPLDRSEAEDALTAWLEHRSVPDAWLTAETLVSAGVTEPRLDEATRTLPEAMVPLALQWLEADLASRRLLDDVAEATRRITELIGSVKAYSNMDRAPTKSAIDVHEGIRSTLAMLAHELRIKEIGLKTELDPLLPRVRGNPGELNQVWMNLIDNAIDVLPPGGEILVATSRSADEAIVQVVDNGPGMPPEVQRRAFEPFFTTKAVGDGAGLGLDIVHRIVRDHEGSVHIESAPGRTCFEVRLPASPSEPVSKPA